MWVDSVARLCYVFSVGFIRHPSGLPSGVYRLLVGHAMSVRPSLRPSLPSLAPPPFYPLVMFFLSDSIRHSSGLSGFTGISVFTRILPCFIEKS